jgi:hypothetical protein
MRELCCGGRVAWPVRDRAKGARMLAESQPVVAVVPKKRRRKPWRKPPPPYDRRTYAGKRVVELVHAFRQRLGADADLVLGAAIERAARLTVFSEELSAKALRGENISPDDVIRASRAADHAVRRLQLDRKAQPTTPTLSDYLRAHHDDEAAP